MEGKNKEEGEVNKGEEIITPFSPPTPSVRNEQEDHHPVLAKHQENLLESMKKKKKEKEDSTKKMKPVRKKKGAKKEEEAKKAAEKEEEDKKAAEQMEKMMKRLRKPPIDRAEAARNTGDVNLSSDVDNCDKKTNDVVEEVVDEDRTVGGREEGRRTQGSPLGKVRAALRKFSYTGREEESYEEWKKRKMSRKNGEKRK